VRRTTSPMPNNADRLDTLLAAYIAVAATAAGVGLSCDVPKAGLALAMEDEDGTAVAKAVGGVLKLLKPLIPTLESLTDAATITPNCANNGGNVAALGQNTTLANPTGTPQDGQEYVLRVKTSSARTWTYGSQYRGGTVALQTATTGSSKTDYHTFRYNAADTKWDLVRLVLNM
jgi:hypothetical protein